VDRKGERRCNELGNGGEIGFVPPQSRHLFTMLRHRLSSNGQSEICVTMQSWFHRRTGHGVAFGCQSLLGVRIRPSPRLEAIG